MKKGLCLLVFLLWMSISLIIAGCSDSVDTPVSSTMSVEEALLSDETSDWAGTHARQWTEFYTHTGYDALVALAPPVAEHTSGDTEIPENPWDVNGDGVVDQLDIAIVADYFGQDMPVECSYNPDVNRDGIVDIVDLVLVAIHYSETYQR